MATYHLMLTLDLASNAEKQRKDLNEQFVNEGWQKLAGVSTTWIGDLPAASLDAAKTAGSKSLKSVLKKARVSESSITAAWLMASPSEVEQVLP